MVNAVNQTRKKQDELKTQQMDEEDKRRALIGAKPLQTKVDPVLLPKNPQPNDLGSKPVNVADVSAQQPTIPLTQVGVGGQPLDPVGKLQQAGEIGNTLKNNPEQLKTITDLMNKRHLTPEQATSDPILQGILRAGINEQDVKTIKSGGADVSAFAQYVESLPGIAEIKVHHISIAQFAGATPSAKVKETIGVADDLAKSSADLANLALTNPLMLDQTKTLIRKNQETLSQLQSKIKLISIQSTAIQNSPESVIAVNAAAAASVISMQETYFKLGMTYP